MVDRISLINNLYQNFDEEARLCKSRHGELEYITTMNFIHRYAASVSGVESVSETNILEVGAGTGRYSIALAREGYNVTALELVESNLEIMKRNIGYMKNITALQGDALDLSRFKDNSFDITLVLGPMYHLFAVEDLNQAIDEAIRVTKKDGVIFFAYLSVHGVLYCNFLKGNFEAGCKINLDKNLNTRHELEQRFSAFGVEEFESLFKDKSTEYLTTVAAEGILELAEKRTDFKMTDHDFKLYVKYHLLNCQRRELLGSSSHLIYICKKK